jgi:hypothetical protein
VQAGAVEGAAGGDALGGRDGAGRLGRSR